MNRKIYLSGLTAAVIMMIGMNACKKEESVSYSGNGNNPEVAMMTKAADDEYRSGDYSGGDEAYGFSVTNSGIPEDYTLTADDMDDDGGKRHSPKRHTNCLKKLNLSDTQKMEIRVALTDFDSCRFADIQQHIDSLKSLIVKIELSRQQLILDYKAGLISRGDFQLGLKGLRADFKVGLIAIKMQHADHLRDCYKTYLSSLQIILTPAQWQTFVNCRK